MINLKQLYRLWPWLIGVAFLTLLQSAKATTITPGSADIKLGAFSQCFLATQSDDKQSKVQQRLRDPKHPIKLSLRDAVMLALRCNPTIVNAEIGRISQKFALKVAQNDFEWKFTLSGTAGYNWSKSAGVTNPTTESYGLSTTTSRKSKYGGSISVGVNHNFDGTLYHPDTTVTLTQPLLKGAGQAIALISLKDAYDTEEKNKLGFLKSIITTVTTIGRDYRALIRNQNDLATQESALRDAIKTFETNKARIKHGKMKPSENITQQTAIDERKLGVVTQKNQISVSRQTLLSDIGLDPDLAIEVPGDVTLDKLEVPEMQKTIEYALLYNIDYITSLINYRVSKRGLMKAKDDLRWKLDASASATLGKGTGGGQDAGIQSLFNGRNHAQNVGLSLEIPIDNLSLQNAWLTKRVSLEQEKTNLAKAQRDLITSVKNKIINLRSQVEQIRISKQFVDSAQRTYEITLKKQQLGRASALDVFQSSDKLVSAKQTYIINKIAYLDAVADLQAELATTTDKWGIQLRY